MIEKRYLRYSVVVIVLILAISMIFPGFNTDFEIYGVTAHASKKQAVKPPEISAKSAVVYCENTGDIIFDKDMHAKSYPYSTTKVLTALLAAQRLPLDQQITVSQAASEVDGSSMNLVAGEVVTVEDLLYGLMLPSGNDAAYALAEAVSGDINSFAALMNETANNIGTKNTHFINPNGIKDEEHYTSAYDMMQIFKVASSDDVVRRVSGTKTKKIPATNLSGERNLKNTADVLFDKNLGVVSAKTGSWDDEKTLVFRYEKDGLKLVVAIMQSPPETREADAKALIKYAEKSIKGIRVIKTGKSVGKVAIKGGVKTRLNVFTSEEGIAYVPKEGSNKLISTKVDLDENVKAPIKSGTQVGKYIILVADEPVNEIPLIIHESVKKGWLPSQIGISNLATVIILSVIFFILFLWIMISARRARIRKRKALLRRKKIEALARKQLEEEERRRQRGWNF